MSTRNRERVARYGLEVMVQMAHNFAGNQQMALALTGILENLFKLSEETCTKVSPSSTVMCLCLKAE